MKMPNLLACLIALLTAANASDFQLGQLSARTRLGEPLDARIELYGITAAEAAELKLELKPSITARRGTAERNAAAALQVQVTTPANGSPYLKLRSTIALTEPVIEFRVRAASGATTTISHFTLALLPAAYTTGSVRARSAETGPAAEQAAQTYGPVRSGQTLWRILRELGLHQGNTAQLIDHILRVNPHAFSNGDADRLRVGVMLEIPALQAGVLRAPTEQSIAAHTAKPQAQVTNTTAAPIAAVGSLATALPDSLPTHAAAVPNQFRDAETAARLAALASKFAEIRARYAEQLPAQSAQAEVSGSTIVANDAAMPEAESAAIQPSPPITRQPRQGTAADRSVEPEPARATAPVATETSWTTLIVRGAGATLVLVALIQGGIVLVRRWRTQRAHGYTTAADQELVAGIARKAEQRLQLEDEVKRRIADKRASTPAAATTVERSVERDGATAALDDIENRIAHGQYAQAEAMLNDVIAKTPNNYRAKLRLAEIYYLNERADEFVALAAAISAHHREDIGDEGWQRVMRMGKVIAPDRPPFSGPVQVEFEA